MKTKLIIIAAFATVGLIQNANAQWVWAGAVGASNVYTSWTGSNAGIGLTAPTYKLHVATGTSNDGIFVDQTGGGACSLFLQNTAGSGNLWSLNHESSGDFSIYDGSTGINPLFIDGTNDNVVIGGTNLTPNASLEASEISGVPATAIAVHAHADNGVTDNYGVYAWTGTTGGSNLNVGVFGQVGNNAGATNAGIYGDDGFTGTGWTNTPSQWAGFFNGGVWSTAGYNPSDRKLKSDIKPLANSLDKLMLLKPSAYKYKTNDFPGMSLPQGNQMGFIAQELEEVFPDLIAEVKGHTLPTQPGKEARKVEGHKAINYTGLIPFTIAALQDEHKIVEQQQQQLTQLAGEIQELKNQMTALQEKKQLMLTGIEQADSEFAGGFFMEQNKPNPYSTETTIQYRLPLDINNAFMAIYDLSGKQLATYPVSQSESSLTLKANDLAAGIYLYSIVADNKVMGTKRMVVSGK